MISTNIIIILLVEVVVGAVVLVVCLKKIWHKIQWKIEPSLSTNQPIKFVTFSDKIKIYVEILVWLWNKNLY